MYTHAILVQYGICGHSHFFTWLFAGSDDIDQCLDGYGTVGSKTSMLVDISTGSRTYNVQTCACKHDPDKL